MYHEYSQEQLRSFCRTNIESLEMWARRLIHQKMSQKFGDDYIAFQKEDETYIVKTEIRNHVKQMMAKEPDRFNRPVDTLFLDDIIYFLCNKEWYKPLYKEALDYAYPQGCEEAREFLSRLIPIRNALSHTNPISIRQVEQAICYSQDFVEGIKKYYKNAGFEKMWNVPTIIQYNDSLGNSSDNLDDSNGIIGSVIISVSTEFRCGDTYSIWVQVDPSFEKGSYKIVWKIREEEAAEFRNLEKFTTTFGTKDIAVSNDIQCIIISNQEWHKHGVYDHRIFWSFTVLPPV